VPDVQGARSAERKQERPGEAQKRQGALVGQLADATLAKTVACHSKSASGGNHADLALPG
jgi:hypothetical protein